MRVHLKACVVVLLALAVAAVIAAVLPAAAAADATSVPTLAVTASPQVVTCGAPTTVTATIDVPGASLTLSAKAAGESAFAPVGTLVVDANGAAAWQISPSATTTYQVDYPGDATWQAAAAETTVAVRPSLTLTASAWVYEGQSAKIGVTVAPAHPHASVRLQILRSGAWRTLKTLVLDGQSRAAFAWVSGYSGTVAFRFAMAADATHIAAASAARRVVVKAQNPWHVLYGPAHFVVVVISKYRLYYLEHGHIVRSFACVTGRPSMPTPIGHFRIYARDPHMSGQYGPRRMRYLGLFAIHGTDEPWYLSRFPRNYSHGCTRLANTNIIWLFARCPLGTQVWNIR